MSHVFQLVLTIFLSVLGAGFLIWLFWLTLKRAQDPAKMLFKEILTLVLVVGEIYLVRRMGGNLSEGGIGGNFGPAKMLVKEILTLVLVVGEIYLVRRMGGNLSEGGIGGNFGPAIMIASSLAALGVFLSILWTSEISGLLFSPITNLFDGGDEPPEPKPLYSAALTKRKKGRPVEAVMLVREQLAKFPEDFEGVLLLANILAEDLNDLPGAAITLSNHCQSPTVPERQVVAAMTQLADWHVKQGPDIDSARAALQIIVDRFPGTEAALRAEQRLAHLGETEKILLARHDRQAIPVPEGVKNIGLLDSTEFLKPKEIEPGQLAASYVKHLDQHPNDAEVREKLATIYARDFKRLDMATMELAQLIHESRYTPRQIIGWLNLLATFQVELGATEDEVRSTLGQILENFPGSAGAEVAARRLARLSLEFQGKKETPGVKLGVYEQNIGLKYGSPRKL